MLKGRQFDADGNLVEWWDDETIAKFEQKAKCMIEQYGNYTDEQTMLSVSHLKCEQNDGRFSLIESKFF